MHNDLRERLSQVRSLIFDMDGTLVLGNSASGAHEVLPGAIELLAALKARGVPFRVFTNGTAKAPRVYAASLRAAGMMPPIAGPSRSDTRRAMAGAGSIQSTGQGASLVSRSSRSG